MAAGRVWSIARHRSCFLQILSCWPILTGGSQWDEIPHTQCEWFWKYTWTLKSCHTCCGYSIDDRQKHCRGYESICDSMNIESYRRDFRTQQLICRNYWNWTCKFFYVSRNLPCANCRKKECDRIERNCCAKKYCGHGNVLVP